MRHIPYPKNIFVSVLWTREGESVWTSSLSTSLRWWRCSCCQIRSPGWKVRHGAELSAEAWADRRPGKFGQRVYHQLCFSMLGHLSTSLTLILAWQVFWRKDNVVLWDNARSTRKHEHFTKCFSCLIILYPHLRFAHNPDELSGYQSFQRRSDASLRLRLHSCQVRCPLNERSVKCVLAILFRVAQVAFKEGGS